MSKKILVVDDEPEIQEIFKTFFTSIGFPDVYFAADGLEAFAICSQHKFDLITLDHQMPFMNGASFLVALRSKKGANQTCPVFMISAFIPDIEDSVKAFENTFFFDKPVNFEKLARNAKITLSKKESPSPEP
jgi:DNA-binding response OmpR family regulator